MGVSTYRALVVDDEPAVRAIAMRELSRSGFTCDAARDGLHAKELLSDRSYDVVITDLRMPDMNGHALAVEILELSDRPLLVILTGVTEPRLARDLIARGVDDILFKPIDQSVLASKVRALVERRAAQAAGANAARQVPPELAQDSDVTEADSDEFDARLNQFVKIAPISSAALDVVKMTHLDTVETRQLAKTIELDASLAAELLRIANSALYNPTGRAAAGIEEAVVRIGQKRTGELALAMSTLKAIKTGLASWMDMTLLWRRSVAAGLAIDRLVAQGGHSRIGAGLYLSAIMHPLGRIALNAIYPEKYDQMLRLSQQSCQPLKNYEDRVFHRTHCDVMAHVLEEWGIPAAAFESLKYARHEPAFVSRLPEPLSTKVQLIQLAILIARFAVGRWEPWDLVRCPAADTAERLAIESLDDVIEQTRLELDAIGQLTDLGGARGLQTSATPSEGESRYIRYCNLSTAQPDLLRELLPALGIKPQACLPEDLPSDEPAIVNCLGVAMHELQRHSSADRFATGPSHVLVTDTRDASGFSGSAVLLALPASFGAIRSALLPADGVPSSPFAPRK